MKTILDHLRSSTNKQENRNNMKEFMEARADILASAGEAIIVANGLSTSVLLSEIATVNAPEMSLGVAYMLAAQSRALQSVIMNSFLKSVVVFSKNLNQTTALFAEGEVAVIFHAAANVACFLQKPRMLVQSVKLVSEKLRQEHIALNAVQADLLQLYISGQMYPSAYDYITNTVILEINLKNTSVTVTDFLRYFYYSGLICIGMRKYSQAIDNFLQVITTPASAVSDIVVQAIYKCTLVSLIEYGTVFELPKDTPQVVQRYVKNNPSKVYEELNKYFKDNDTESLTGHIHTSRELLNKNGNFGLAKQLPDALIRHRIGLLTNTYITLSLQDIAAISGLATADEAEKHLLYMVDTGKITVRISQETGMVRFLDSQENSSAFDVIGKLQSNMHQSIKLAEELRRLQSKVLTSTEYISKLNSSSKGAGGVANWDGDLAESI